MLRNCGLKVILTREDDRLLYKAEENIKGIRKISDLRNRAEIARQNDNSIFVSIHMNSYSEPQYSGLQVYYSLVNPLSERLAQIVQTKVCERLQPFNNRKIKEGRSLYLMKNISSPAILIECGFLSNAEECEKISQKEYQKQLCFSFVCAIIEYMKAYHSEG